MAIAPAKTQPDPAAVVTKAFIRAADDLNVSNAVRARILGVDRASITRLAQGRRIDPDKRGEGENALLFLRIARSLSGLFGGNMTQCRTWLTGHNHHLGGVPLELMQSTVGIVHVADYLDAMRGQ